MPRKPIDYSKCVFYRLVCRDVTVTEVYVGSTTNEFDRRRCHKSDCHNENGPRYNYFVYRFIREHGGWGNWQLLVHEKLAVKDDVEARLRERFWTEHYQATLNKQLPGRTHKESCSNWYTNHREEQNKRYAAYNLAHETHLKEKHDCPCGGKYTTNGYSHHIKTKKHLVALN